MCQRMIMEDKGKEVSQSCGNQPSIDEISGKPCDRSIVVLFGNLRFARMIERTLCNITVLD